MAIMTKSDIIIAAMTPAEMVVVDLVDDTIGPGDLIDLPQSRMSANREQ